MLKDLANDYIRAFDSKDLNEIATLLVENFILEDPVVKRIEGKNNALDVMRNIFESCDELSFFAKNIYVEKNVTIIEFILKMDEVMLTGTDIIEWKDDKMKELRAYLDIPKV